MNISLLQTFWNESWNGFIANCCACITCLVNNKCLALNYLKLTFQVWVHLFSKSTSLILALQHNDFEFVWKKMVNRCKFQISRPPCEFLKVNQNNTCFQVCIQNVNPYFIDSRVPFIGLRDKSKMALVQMWILFGIYFAEKSA